MDNVFERCFLYSCPYEINFNNYVYGVIPLSSGFCPECERVDTESKRRGRTDDPPRRSTVTFCPGCQSVSLTQQYIQNNFECGHCNGKLVDFCKQRKILLAGHKLKEQVIRHRTPLQPRELAVLRLIVEDHSNKEVASILGITPRTVDTYRARIMFKTQVHSAIGLVHYALAHELLSLSNIRGRYLY